MRVGSRTVRVGGLVGKQKGNVGNGVQQTQGHSAVCLCRGRSGDDDDCFKGQTQVKDGNTDDDDGGQRAIGLVGFWNRGTKGGETEREEEATGESVNSAVWWIQGQTDRRRSRNKGYRRQWSKCKCKRKCEYLASFPCHLIQALEQRETRLRGATTDPSSWEAGTQGL